MEVALPFVDIRAVGCTSNRGASSVSGEVFFAWVCVVPACMNGSMGFLDSVRGGTQDASPVVMKKMCGASTSMLSVTSLSYVEGGDECAIELVRVPHETSYSVVEGSGKRGQGGKRGEGAREGGGDGEGWRGGTSGEEEEEGGGWGGVCSLK